MTRNASYSFIWKQQKANHFLVLLTQERLCLSFWNHSQMIHHIRKTNIHALQSHLQDTKNPQSIVIVGSPALMDPKIQAESKRATSTRGSVQSRHETPPRAILTKRLDITECENYSNPNFNVNKSNNTTEPKNSDHTENNAVSGDTDDDFDIIEKRLGNTDTFQDPQRVLPAEAADDDILELPAVRVRKYLSRKAKELSINYVHHADSQETAATLPPGMLSTISPKTKLSTTERLNDEPHMVFPAKLGSSSPYQSLISILFQSVH
ncbi:hypothetical protein CRE_01409 [Caenorhabditis remanei]|uniref:Uncharacterized protein n=1 Tax=Caenorhabditis remanei TaxID=31234 RepID=E3NJ65_CAERE|nr:hypothetical protein CRE_01409 [Caenorhabditis remanei]